MAKNEDGFKLTTPSGVEVVPWEDDNTLTVCCPDCGDEEDFERNRRETYGDFVMRAVEDFASEHVCEEDEDE